MTIDGIILNAICKELKEKLTNGKIQKINQVNKNLLIINIYSDKNHKLLMSADSQAPRIHLSTKDYKNPLTPSNFTMILRKHLSGSRIKSIEQNGLDRTIEITIDARNELGIEVERKLVVDLMGKHSNIVLLDESNKVIEAIKRVSHDMSRVRAVYPGTIFENIASDKFNVLADEKTIFDLEIADNMKIFKIFYTFFEGFSPTIGREISYRANLDPKRNYGSLEEDEKNQLNNAFHDIVEIIRNSQYKPNLIYQEDKISEFYCFELEHLSKDIKTYESISEVIDEYYILNTNDDSLNQSRNNLLDLVKKQISRKSNKLDLMVADYEKSKDHESIRIEGELLQANSFMIKRGQKSIQLLNYYSNENVDIALDERKDAWQNIELKYKQSKKLKKANELLKQSIPKQKDEISYLQGIKRQIEQLESHEELQEIRNELYEQGYIKSTGKKKSSKKEKPSKPHKYISKDGATIFVGKNNKQNEQITLRDANKEDLFFHIKDLPGSHVIMKKDNNNFTDDDIYAAAYLAANHSKYSDEKFLDVDYTEKKNVFKQKAAKPGMVHYINFTTIRVNLDDRVDLRKE